MINFVSVECSNSFLLSDLPDVLPEHTLFNLKLNGFDTTPATAETAIRSEDVHFEFENSPQIQAPDSYSIQDEEMEDA